MAMIKEMEVNGKTFEIYHFTGEVVDKKKWSETEVSGGGGGGSGYSYNGFGSSHSYTAPVRSRTTRFDQIILNDDQGKEKSFQFQDLDLACRTGNKLSVVWGIRKGKKTGKYWFVYNHNSDEIYYTQEFKSIFSLGFMKSSGVMAGGAFAAYLLGMSAWMYVILPLVSLIVFRFAYYGPMGNLKSDKFKISHDHNKLLGQLQAG